MQSRSIITWAIVAAAILAGGFIYLLSSPEAPEEAQPSPAPEATPIITVQLEPSASPSPLPNAMPMTAPTGPWAPLLMLAVLATAAGFTGLAAHAYAARRLFF